MKKSLAILLVLAGAAGTVAVAWSLWEEDGEPWVDEDDRRLVALGDAVYREHCASCHGASLEGEPEWQRRGPDGRLPAPPHDETGHTWHHPDDQLFEIVKYGIERFAPAGYETDMPVFDSVLTDEEIWAVLAFIKSTWAEREREFQEQISLMAREALE